MFIFLKTVLVYLALCVVTGGYSFSLWMVLVAYFINVEAKRNLSVSYIRSRFFPGELTLLEYHIMVVFYVLGCVTKAKGIVTKEDIQYAENLMTEFKVGSDNTMKILLINSFNKGKLNTYDLSQVIVEFCSFFKDNPRAKSYLFDYQLTAVVKDGQLLDKELEVLTIIAKQIGMSAYSFNKKIKSAEDCYQFKQRFNHQSMGRGSECQDDKEKSYNHQYQQDKSYYYHYQANMDNDIRNKFDVLGVKEYDDYVTVKKAYRMLINEYHPDKFVSKDVPLAIVNKAKEKSQEVIGAYDLICRIKGWK
ncbi:MAG: co-chaperone DjlA [Neisseriaceae bacterium]|nr:MAG: co-chaperone DjlA [Neisseriaceae bacterium]